MVSERYMAKLTEKMEEICHCFTAYIGEIILNFLKTVISIVFERTIILFSKCFLKCSNHSSVKIVLAYYINSHFLESIFF